MEFAGGVPNGRKEGQGVGLARLRFILEKICTDTIPFMVNGIISYAHSIGHEETEHETPLALAQSSPGLPLF